MSFVLAVDGGGTKTTAALCDTAGRLVAIRRGPRTNPHDVGLEAAEEALRETVRGVLGQAGADARDVRHVYGCFAGQPDFTAPLAELMPKADVRLVFEAVFCLASALGDRRGAVVLAGTGAFEWARGPAGDSRVDGLGMFLGDEGSAYWIARQALIAGGRAFDGRGPASALETLVPTMRAAFYNVGPPDRHFVASMAREVTAAADAGDAIARAICRLAAHHLARGARVVCGRAGLEGGFPIVLAGSVLRGADAVAAPLAHHLRRIFPAADIRRADLEPVLGGVLLALRDAGVEWSDALAEALASAYRDLAAAPA